MTGTQTPERIATAVLANHAIQPNWIRTGEQVEQLLIEAARIAQTPDPTKETPEQIAAKVILEFHLSSAVLAVTAAAVRAGIQTAWESWEPETANVEPELTGKYLELWQENMPRLSGRMYFAMPGEQPLHVYDDQARRILAMLSAEDDE